MKHELFELVVSVSANLAGVSSTLIDRKILGALTQVGQYAGADRAYLFTFSEDESLLDNPLEWCRNGIERMQYRNRHIPLGRYAWLRRQLSEHRCVAIDDIRELPAEAEVERCDFQARQARSLMFIPLWHEKQLLGFIGFDKVLGHFSWSSETRRNLCLLAQVVAATLSRQESSPGLAQTAADFRKFMQPLPGMVFQYEIDSVGEPRMPFVCERMESVLGLSSETLKRTATPLLDRIHEQDHGRVLASISDSSEQLNPFREEFRMRTGDGEAHWFQAIAIPEKSTDRVLWHGYLSEITDQMLSEQTIIDQGLWTQAILENIDDVIFSIDQSGIIQSVNYSAEQLFGYTVKELKGSKINMIMPEPHRSRHDGYIERYLRTGDTAVMGKTRELEAERRDGTVFPIELQVSEINMNESRYFIGVVRDITERKASEKKIDNLAYYDPLTGLPNRSLLIDRMEQERVASANEGAKRAVLFLDLDNFKNLNDSLGHSVGDRYLLQVARRLESKVASKDTVARIGGDEFVVLVTGLDLEPEVASQQARQIADDIRQALAAPFQMETYEYIGSFSIGVTLFHDHEETLENLLKQGDIALYQAKNAGKNTVCLFDAAIQRAVEDKLKLESDIRQAMAHKQFELHYQPQIVEGGTVTSVEALVRWHHPEEGWISPGQFIPVCEETGLILELGAWVVETACRQLAAWAREASTSGLIVAVNISAKQFHQHDFVDQVIRSLERTGAPAQQLELELTESLLVQDIDDVVNKMDTLRQYGVRFSLDDFGTGYSSLSYLKRMPFNQLKIDKGFVKDILKDENDLEIAKMIVALADAMQLEVIAEGVETWSQCKALSAVGCYRYQGFLFSMPMPAEEVILAIARTDHWANFLSLSQVRG